MRWPFQRSKEPDARLPHARPGSPPVDDDIAAFVLLAFVCTQCGRDDLPPAGDWDPPICQECDAAINFDAEIEAGYFDDVLGL